MTDQPLQPFAPPAMFGQVHINLSSSGAIEVMLAIVFGIWLIYTLVAIYHWLRYSHASSVALPAIAIYLVVSIGLMSFALTGHTTPTL